jgi:hypothetical protein
MFTREGIVRKNTIRSEEKRRIVRSEEKRSNETV